MNFIISSCGTLALPDECNALAQLMLIRNALPGLNRLKVHNMGAHLSSIPLFDSNLLFLPFVSPSKQPALKAKVPFLPRLHARLVSTGIWPGQDVL
jgi:hypothetical protein